MSASMGGRLRWLILIGVLAVLVARFIPFASDVAVRPSHGFVNYYTASRLLHSPVPVSQLYDDRWFSLQTEQFTPGITDIFTPHPPTAALMFVPLAGLDYVPARIVWTAFSLIVLALALGWLLRDLGLRGGQWLLSALALVLLYQPFYAQMAYGQVYAALTALLVLAWYGYCYRRNSLLGVALGVMLVFKTAGVLLLGLLLIQRRWRALLWTVCTALAVMLVSLPRLGLDSWQTYMGVLAVYGQRPSHLSAAYQTPHSLFKRLFVPDAVWNPAPLFDAPAVGAALALAAVLTLAGISAYRVFRNSDTDGLLFAAFVTAGLLISPVSLDYHFVLLLVPILILIAHVRNRSLIAQACLAVAVTLIALNMDWNHPADGAGVLLFYPKLYGALLLWGLALRKSA